MKKIRILFICLGNICRSPAAQALAMQWAEQRGVGDQLEIASAGTANYQVGRPADPRMRAAAARRGIEIETTAQQLTYEMTRSADWLIAMDRENYRDTARIARDAPPSGLCMLSDFLDGSWPRDVPDPYLGGEEGFVYVLDMLEAAMPKLFLRVLPGGLDGAVESSGEGRNVD